MNGRPPADAAALNAQRRQYKRKKAAIDDAKRVRANRRESVPESPAFTALRALEREIDAVVRARREAQHSPEMTRETVRVYVFHTHDGGERFSLKVVGRRVSEVQEDVERGGSTDGAWMNGDVDSARFGNFLKRLEVSIEGQSRTKMWTSDAERANQSPDAFEIRGETRGAETLDATIKLVMVGMNERYRVGKDMAELIGTLFATRKRTIAELWTYFTVNGLVNEDDASMVKPDAPMVEVLERAGFDGLKEGQVAFRDVCEFVLGKLLTPVEPVEIKYKIKTTGLSPSKPDCYDIEVHCPKTITSSVNPYADRPVVDKELEQCETRIRRAYQYVDAHLARRNFLLQFAESPVDFIKSCVLGQAKGVYEHNPGHAAMSHAQSAPARPSVRDAKTYKEPWIDEAVMRLLS